MKTILDPLGDYVVVKTEEAPTKTASGILLPKDTYKPDVVVVVAVGGEVRQVEKIKVGTRLIYKSFSGTAFKLGGEDFILIQEQDLLSVIKETK